MCCFMIDQLWHIEKLQLEMKNLELVNAIEVKNNEVQRFEKKLEHMVSIMLLC